MRDAEFPLDGEGPVVYVDDEFLDQPVPPTPPPPAPGKGLRRKSVNQLRWRNCPHDHQSDNAVHTCVRNHR